MSKAGCPYDNAPMERFYNTFKSNFYNITSFSSVEMMDELSGLAAIHRLYYMFAKERGIFFDAKPDARYHNGA